jgi:hypothetical protein
VVAQHFNNWREAQLHIAARAALPAVLQQLTEFVLIDDCSSHARTSEEELPPNVAIARILDVIPWNQSGARNLGVHIAQADWLLLIDIDHHFSADSMDAIVRSLPELDRRTAYRFERTDESGVAIRPGHNVKLLHRSGFNAIGGVDEDFAGAYGLEDHFFSWRWEQAGFKTQMHPSARCTVHKDGKTRGLPRDTRRNTALLEKKIQAGMPGSHGPTLRFRWTLVEHAGRG